MEKIQNLSIQPRARGENSSYEGGFTFLVHSGQIVPPWWSYHRDRELRRFWKQSDHLSGAMYNFISKMRSIDVKVMPRDNSIRRHVEDAEKWNMKLQYMIENGNGWNVFYPKWIEDYHGTDNGAFFEIVGEGQPDGPIEGEVLTIYNLDSNRCIRTGDPEYPVVYSAPRGGRHKLHYTRVAYASQLPSADEEMKEVGFCSVSRAINTAQNLLDMSIYKQEKLGSRPQRGIVVVNGGLDPQRVGKALELAYQQANTRGLSRYMPTTIVGDPSKPDGSLEIVDVSSLPDGFDYESDTTLGMAVIALAFGVDARELFPMSGSGATRADALIQHIKQRGKGPGETIQTIEMLLNSKVLPPYLKAIFDVQDDAQDRQEAEIDNIRAQRREHDLQNGVTDIRVEREIMLEEGEITEEQFVQLELKDGRLDNGDDVLTLFETSDPAIKSMLELDGVSAPLNTAANDRQTVLDAIAENKNAIARVMHSTDSARLTLKARQAIAALDALAKLYTSQQERSKPQPQPTAQTEMTQDETMPNDDEAMLGDNLSMDDELKQRTIELYKTKSKQEYFNRIKSIVGSLWRGAIDIVEFSDVMEGLLFAQMRQAFLEGAKEVGIQPDELTQEEQIKIDNLAFNQLPYIVPFGEYIIENNRDSGKKLSSIDYRIELWAQRYNEAMNAGRLSARNDPKLMWRLGATEEHCSTCVKLNGKVKRASYWQERGIAPQNAPNALLECGGWNCDCKLEPTDEPLSRGPLPAVP